MATNVAKVHADAVSTAEKRVEVTIDQFRKIANMRKWALTAEERQTIVGAIGDAYNAMADSLLNAPEAGFRLS